MEKQRASFEYNLPLQAYKQDDGSIKVLNYMPRKECCKHLDLSELEDLKDENEIRDYFYGVACNLLNLAILFAEFADGKRESVYYHDEDIDKHFYPSPYEVHLRDHKILPVQPKEGV